MLKPQSALDRTSRGTTATSLAAIGIPPTVLTVRCHEFDLERFDAHEWSAPTAH
jgi:hypothetical protein